MTAVKKACDHSNVVIFTQSLQFTGIMATYEVIQITLLW